MTDDTERLVAEIDADLKRLAKADPRTIKQIVESALSREFQTGNTAAIERRIEEKRNRLNQVEQERNERERELAQVKDELSRLETQLEKATPDIDEAVESLSTVPSHELTEDNVAVQRWVEQTGRNAEYLIDKVEEQR
jgi:septal ring factor EnvC (AmiA/AmiB activator)